MLVFICIFGNSSKWRVLILIQRFYTSLACIVSLNCLRKPSINFYRFETLRYNWLRTYLMTTCYEIIIYIHRHLTDSILVLLRLNSTRSTNSHSLSWSWCVGHYVWITAWSNTLDYSIRGSRLIWCSNRRVSDRWYIVGMRWFSNRIRSSSCLWYLSLLTLIITFWILCRILNGKIWGMTGFWIEIRLLEKSWSIEIPRIDTVSLTKISTSGICVLHHALNHCIKTKTLVRYSLLNSSFVKFFINNHRIT